LIRSIRRAKTAAEERAVVARESADIRTALKDKGNSYRARNVAKLMYIHMLGHSADYGQMACLELISSQSYTDKRVGYLAMSVLFDENVQLLTLVENCLRK
jgi:AP-1 complex subunit gamma-1